jgi:thioesterase domain-containing protein
MNRASALHSAGTHAPTLWAMPGLMGDSAWAWELAAAWPGPAYALTARGLDGAEELPFDRVEAIAAELAPSVEGDGLLVGWSFGGLLAWELARRLRREDRPPLGVALLDCRALIEARGTWTRGALLRGFAQTCGRRLGLPSLEQSFLAQPDEAREGWLFARVGEALGDPRQARRRWSVFEAHSRAWHAYRPKPYEGRALLIEAAPAPSHDALGWAAWCRDAPTLDSLDATHEDLVRAPHASALSARLARWAQEDAR